MTRLLEDEIDISRGDMSVKIEEAPLDPNRRYVLGHTTRETRALVAGISHRLDINTRERNAARQRLTNDITRMKSQLENALCIDAYAENRAIGAFILIAEATKKTVGAGMIL